MAALVIDTSSVITSAYNYITHYINVIEIIDDSLVHAVLPRMETCIITCFVTVSASQH